MVNGTLIPCCKPATGAVDIVKVILVALEAHQFALDPEIGDIRCPKHF